MESGLISSLYQNCQHQIVFARFNLKVVFSPPYEREVCYFQKANAGHSRKAINRFRWEAFTCLLLLKVVPDTLRKQPPRGVHIADGKKPVCRYGQILGKNL